MNGASSKRLLLYQWVFWFFLINIVLSSLVMFCYLSMLPPFDAVAGATPNTTFLGILFFVLAFLTQSSLFMLVCGLIVCIGITIWPKKVFAFSLANLLVTALLFGLLADSIAYRLYHFHYASVGWHVFKSGSASQVIVLGAPEKVITLLIISALIVIEYFFALFAWKWVTRIRRHSLGYVVTGVLCLCIIGSYGLLSVITYFGDYRILPNAANHVILKSARVVPYFSEIYSLLMPGDYTARKIYTDTGSVTLALKQLDKPLHYPLHPLQCAHIKKPMNILIISLDTWRYDAMNQTVTPHIYQFAKRSIQFQNHWSGGNCTRPGIFSLFYALPATYWRAFLSQKKGPVFMHELIHDGYQMGVFASAGLNFPAFDQTVFSEVKPLTIFIPGDSSIARDRAITRYFRRFIYKRDPHKPFFSFLFYDAIHNYCEAELSEQNPFQPMALCNRFTLTKDSQRLPYWNRYRNKAHFVDNEVAKVLDTLKGAHLLKNTIVIITADHGEQLNDEHMGFWVHASAYTSYQLHVPLIVYWPGKHTEVIRYFTTHADIVPTLMQTIFGCHNPPRDYSVGESLFTRGARPYFVAASYGDYAVVTRKDVVRIYPNGDYAIDYRSGHVKPHEDMPLQEMRSVYQMLHRYYY